VSLAPRMKPTGRTDCSPCCRADCGADDWCSCSCCGACLCCGACYVCCFVCGRATAAACGGDGGHVRARGPSAVGCVPPRLRPWTRLLRTRHGARGARRCHHLRISRRCLPRPCVFAAGSPRTLALACSFANFSFSCFSCSFACATFSRMTRRSSAAMASFCSCCTRASWRRYTNICNARSSSCDMSSKNLFSVVPLTPQPVSLPNPVQITKYKHKNSRHLLN
jgi:hypothetical protein